MAMEGYLGEHLQRGLDLAGMGGIQHSILGDLVQGSKVCGTKRGVDGLGNTPDELTPASLHAVQEGRWNDSPCNQTLPSICKKPGRVSQEKEEDDHGCRKVRGTRGRMRL